MKTRGLNCKSFGGCRNESELLKLKFFGSYTHILNKCSCVNYKYFIPSRIWWMQTHTISVSKNIT